MTTQMKDNPEKVMLFLFPLITFGLFVVAAVGLWVIQTNPWGIW
jgi:hypothetical protein